jgi:hypothetical protein
VQKLFLRRFHGRIVGTAIIVNMSNDSVRSTTGSLGLSRGPRAKVTGLISFPVPSLPAGAWKPVRFTTQLIRTMPVPSGTYGLVVCTDVYSQIQRFARNTNCSPGGSLAISRLILPRVSGPVPNTFIRTGPMKDSTSPTAVFRFASSTRPSTFECSLDGGPWIRLPQPPEIYRASGWSIHLLCARD